MLHDRVRSWASGRVGRGGADREGDPIPIRHEFDGEVVTITTDSSFDAFGSGEVDVQVCDGVRRAGRLLEGVDCKCSNGDGSRGDTLPGAG